MSRNLKIVAAFATLALLVAGTFIYMRIFMSPPSELDLARSKATMNGLYNVSVEPERQPLQQGPLHAWIVTVSTPDGKPVSGATLSFDGGMPQHGHGLPTRPQSAGEIGEGRYRIEGVRFNMGGWWVLRIAVDGPAGEDRAEFNIVI